MKTSPWNRRQFIKTGLATSAAAAITTPSLLTHARTLPPASPNAVKLDPKWVVVTEAPFNADPTGQRDSTEALQKALDESRNRSTVCFFPSGTYLISDTLSCEQRVSKLDKPRYTDDMRQSWWDIRSDRYHILGSSIRPRPTIKLSPEAKGFDNPSRPRLAMHIWAQTRNDVPGTHEPEWGSEQPNILFGQIFRGVDFDISGHRGAIGLRFSGSQGCSLMDCHVNARGAFAGFNNCPGQGGGSYNLEVVGGKHALWADANYRFPMLAACRFVDQEESAIVYSDAALPLVLVGCIIRSNAKTAIDLTRVNSFPGVSLVDSMVELGRNASLIKSNSEQNLLLENVWTRGVENLTTSEPNNAEFDSWIHIKSFANCAKNSKSLINGQLTQSTFFESELTETPPTEADLRGPHWSQLPNFEDPDAVNIRDFGALGDGKTDDTAAFAKALAQSPKVYFPRGRYLINRVEPLPANACLFSHKGGTIDGSGWTTHDAADDQTTLAFLHMFSPTTWRSGSGVIAFAAGELEIAETGGGKFYFNRFRNSRTDGQLFANSRQAITIYTLNIERRRTNPQAFVKNVNDLRIFYLKAEANPHGYHVHGGPNTGNTPLAIINSENVRVYAGCGLVITEGDRPFIDVVDSKNVKVSHVRSFRTGEFAQIRERFHGQTTTIPSQQTAALFVRD